VPSEEVLLHGGVVDFCLFDSVVETTKLDYKTPFVVELSSVDYVQNQKNISLFFCIL
jgi:hypothetical protein